jgi:hypothetical protein
LRLFSLTDMIVLVVQSCRVPTPPSTGSLVSVYDQPPLICFGVCGRKAIIKPCGGTVHKRLGQMLLLIVHIETNALETRFHCSKGNEMRRCQTLYLSSLRVQP